MNRINHVRLPIHDFNVPTGKVLPPASPKDTDPAATPTARQEKERIFTITTSVAAEAMYQAHDDANLWKTLV